MAFKAVIINKTKGAEVVKTNILFKKTKPRYLYCVCGGNHYNSFYKNE